MESSFETDAKVFKAFCDPRRLEILKQLRSGEKCACVLQDKMDIGQSGLSYHMKDYPAEKLMRDAKVFSIFEGTNQINLMVSSGILEKIK